MRVNGNDRPDAVEIYTEHGRPWARLTANVHEIDQEGPDGSTAKSWEWDERTIPCPLSAVEVEADFAAWWRAAGEYGKPDSEKIAEVGARAEMLEEAIMELAEILGGE